MRRVGFALGCVMLYAGPLLAGAIGLDWPVVPPLVLIFLLWHLIMRPVQFAAPDLTGRTARFIVTAVVQVILVAGLWQFGRFFAVAPSSAMAAIWPLALSGLALPLCRISRAPETAAFHALLDEAASSLEDIAAQIPPDPSDPAPAPGQLPDRLDRIDPRQATLSDFDAILDDLDTAAAVHALHELRDLPDPAPVHLIAAVVLAMRPDVIEAENYQDQSVSLIRALQSDDPQVVRLAARATLHMFAELDTRAVHVDLPDDSLLLTRAAALADAGREDLAHDIRAIYKAKGFARDDYAAETRLKDDD